MTMLSFKVNLLIPSPLLLLLMSDVVFLIISDYLLSNNHINSIIVHKFDFSDEEVCL